jgi:hypothetical protein
LSVIQRTQPNSIVRAVPNFSSFASRNRSPARSVDRQRTGPARVPDGQMGEPIEDNDMTNYDPNNRTRRVRDDNSGAWIIGIIVLVAIGIGVWWWAGWGGANNGNNVASAPTAPASSTTGAAPARTTPAPATTGSGGGSAPASTPAPAGAPASGR